MVQVDGQPMANQARGYGVKYTADGDAAVAGHPHRELLVVRIAIAGQRSQIRFLLLELIGVLAIETFSDLFEKRLIGSY